MRSLLMANECILEEFSLLDNDSREKLLKCGLFLLPKEEVRRRDLSAPPSE